MKFHDKNLVRAAAISVIEQAIKEMKAIHAAKELAAENELKKLLCIEHDELRYANVDARAAARAEAAASAFASAAGSLK